MRVAGGVGDAVDGRRGRDVARVEGEGRVVREAWQRGDEELGRGHACDRENRGVRPRREAGEASCA